MGLTFWCLCTRIGGNYGHDFMCKHAFYAFVALQTVVVRSIKPERTCHSKSTPFSWGCHLVELLVCERTVHLCFKTKPFQPIGTRLPAFLRIVVVNPLPFQRLPMCVSTRFTSITPFLASEFEAADYRRRVELRPLIWICYILPCLMVKFEGGNIQILVFLM
jgi:hypothetical protein